MSQVSDFSIVCRIAVIFCFSEDSNFFEEIALRSIIDVRYFPDLEIKAPLKELIFLKRSTRDDLCFSRSSQKGFDFYVV
jgi:hypothetical protein